MAKDDLLAKAHQLDNAALATIYDLHSDELYRYAVRLLGDPIVAEDCVADTFSRFLRALHKGKGPRQHLRAYLYRISHNWITDYYRRQPPPTISLRPDLAVTSDENLATNLESKQNADRVRSALLKLTDTQRQVVVLKFYEGWSNAEVAAALGRPIGAIKSLQHRALASLQRHLDKAYE